MVLTRAVGEAVLTAAVDAGRAVMVERIGRKGVGRDRNGDGPRTVAGKLRRERRELQGMAAGPAQRNEAVNCWIWLMVGLEGREKLRVVKVFRHPKLFRFVPPPLKAAGGVKVYLLTRHDVLFKRGYIGHLMSTEALQEKILRTSDFKAARVNHR